MNIKIITRHTPSNYGSLLQSVATIITLEKLGCDAEIIDYKRTEEKVFRKVWTEAKIKNNKLFKRLLYILIRYPIEKYAELRFDKMRSAYISMTHSCESTTELQEINADIFMTGSDQVWGPMVNGKYDPAYFLDFVTKGRKISYAASFGKTKFDEETTKEYKDLLAKYDKISVREDSAVELLRAWGANNCIGQVLDPTLLLTGEDWKCWAEIKKSTTKPYILIYQLHNDANLSSYAQGLAQKTGLDLVRVNPYAHQKIRCGKFVCCPDVKEFLRLINDCSIMITDSFHGTCFAINFNKQFIEILPNNATGTRNQSVLKLTGLTHRIVNDYSDYSIIDQSIDYTKVNKLLDKERENSLFILKEQLF